MATDVQALHARREQLLRDLAAIGTFWRGTLKPRFTTCGKPDCPCADKGHPGHGPYWSVVYKSDGRSRTRNVPQRALPEVREQIDEYHRLRGLVRELGDVSNGLCLAQLDAGKPEVREKRGALKRRLRKRSTPKQGA